VIEVKLDDLDNEAYLRGLRAGEIIERERITEMLKPLAAQLMLDEHPAAGNLVTGIIALIKKEQK
jgi:hypothetical protein